MFYKSGWIRQQLHIIPLPEGLVFGQAQELPDSTTEHRTLSYESANTANRWI